MLKQVLVVDNNPVILKLLTHILQQRRLEVITARDGLSALELLETCRPDLILTDLIMPNIDGEHLCRIIRSRAEFASTILIVVSAIVLEENIDFGAFGAQACIAKGPAAEMAANIDVVITHIETGRIDLLSGMKLGAENLVHRTVTKELLAAKHHLKLTLDNIDNGFIEFSRSDKIIYCNSFALELFGGNQVDMLAIGILDLFVGEAHQHVSECLHRYHTSHGSVRSERSIKVATRDLVFTFIDVPAEDDGSSIMIIRDITEEKIVRRRLREHLAQMETLVAERTRSYEEVNRELQAKIRERQKINEELEFVARQWSNTFDTISDFVSVHDKNMKFVRVNKALADFIGKKPEELLGQYCYEVLHGQSEPWAGCPHLTAIKSGKSVTMEVDDERMGIPLLVTCSPLLHDDGSLMGTVHVARDISEQKKASNERERLISQLEESLSKVKLLSGFIPICSSCKKIRDDSGYWQQVEEYIRDHSEAQFSHSICPKCVKKLYPGILPDEH